jgi:vacuolar-type H+-ATPase catalytic subunit A/Vma1
MLGSLHEIDTQIARMAQVKWHKAKLNARLSFQRGGWLNASDTLEKKKTKVRNTAQEELKKAKRQLAKAELTEREALKRVGIAARAAERERKKTVRDIEAQIKKQVLGINMIIPPELLIPIRNPQNEPTENELEAIRIKHQSLYDKVAKEQAEFDRI